MHSIENQLFHRIKNRGFGSCFTARELLSIGSREAVWQGLSRLEAQGKIRRLAQGLYEYPKRHAEIGILSPDPEQIAQAIAKRDGARIQISGALAAHQLGLTDQVPARAEFLTSGPNRKLQIGSREIVLKRTTLRNMSIAGRISGTVVQALRHIGEDNVRLEQIDELAARLATEQKAQIWADRNAAPGWMLPILKRISGASE